MIASLRYSPRLLRLLHRYPTNPASAASVITRSLQPRYTATKSSEHNDVTTTAATALATKADSLTKIPRVAQFLGYAGAMPFVAGAVATAVTSDPFPFARATQLYGTSILSFLGAVHWGVALRTSVDATPRHITTDFVYGVIPSLIGWGAALLQPAEGLYVLSGSFMIAFLYDSFRFRSGSFVPAWYRRLRLPLSLFAAGGCAAAFWGMRRHRSTDNVCPRGTDALILSTSPIESIRGAISEKGESEVDKDE